VVDIRDQWPDVFFEFLPGFLKKMAPILFRRDIKKLTFALRQATSVTAMMEDILQWGLAYAGRLKTEKDTVFYIGTEKASVPQEACLPQTLHHKLDALKEKKVFVFVGTFSNFYNPEILANVAQMFSNEGREDVVFLLAGNGEYFHNVQEKVSNLNNIYLLGWLQHEEILALLRIASVGIVPLNEARPCFPNKLFIYLSSFLPVIASTPGEFKYLMEKYDIGIYYEPGDVEGLYSSVKKLADNPGLIEQMSKNVEKIFAHLFDSETIYTKFADHIEETAEKFGEKA
jgi:glycosyltransferase involved in cell wall biosynthesis